MHEGCSLYPYQQPGTSRGLTWILRALWVQVGVALATAVFLGSLLLTYGSALRNPTLPEPAMTLAMTYGFSLYASEVIVGIVFLFGFMGLHGSRREYGKGHERKMDQAVLWFVLAFVLLFASNGTSLSGPATPTPSFVPIPIDLVVITVRAVSALFVAITLYACVAALVTQAQRRLLLVASVLGILSAVGQSVLMSMGSLSPTSPEVLPVAIVGVTIVGAGLSMASLLMFILAFRGVRRNLETGVIPRILPPGWPVPFSPPYSPGGPGSPPRRT